MPKHASLFLQIIYHAPKRINFTVNSKEWETKNVEQKRDENGFEGIRN